MFVSFGILDVQNSRSSFPGVRFASAGMPRLDGGSTCIAWGEGEVNNYGCCHNQECVQHLFRAAIGSPTAGVFYCVILWLRSVYAFHACFVDTVRVHQVQDISIYRPLFCFDYRSCDVQFFLYFDLWLRMMASVSQTATKDRS